MSDSRERLRVCMHNMGFTEATAAVYTALLENEYLSVTRLVESTNLSLEEVNVCLHHLLNCNAIVIDSIKSKSAYYALDPTLVWSAFDKRTIWRFIHTLVDTDIDTSIAQLPDSHRLALQHARNATNEVRIAASNLYGVSQSVAKHRWRDAVEPDQLSRLLAETIQYAQSGVRGVSKSPRLRQVDLIWQSIRSVIEKGVKYQRVADLTEVIEHGLLIVTRDIQEHNIELRVLDTPEIDQKFYVIDRTSLVVFHQSGMGDATSAVGRVTNHKDIIARYRKRFDKLYSSAVPGLTVVAILRQSSERILERAANLGFSSTELEWLQKVIDWGRFCLEPDPFDGVTDSGQHPAVAAGLLATGTTGHLVPIYDVSMHDIKAISIGASIK